MTRAGKRHLQVLTASRLRDGAVVYAAAEGWSERFADAEILASPEAAEARLRLAAADQRACLVVEPYLIDVEAADGGPRPRGMRELIRARRTQCIVTMNSMPES